MATPAQGQQVDEVHRVQRPAWTCVADGAAWPCVSAQEALREAFHNGRAGLVGHLSFLMAQAATDLQQDDPTRLYRRFVRWALPDDRGCRVCGKLGHDAFPGVPLRLVPCPVAKQLHPDVAATCPNVDAPFAPEGPLGAQ